MWAFRSVRPVRLMGAARTQLGCRWARSNAALLPFRTRVSVCALLSPRQANQKPLASPECGTGGGRTAFPAPQHAAASTSSSTDSPKGSLRATEQYVAEGLTPPILRAAMQQMPLPLLTPETVLTEWRRGRLLGTAYGTAWSPPGPAQHLLAAAGAVSGS